MELKLKALKKYFRHFVKSFLMYKKLIILLQYPFIKALKIYSNDTESEFQIIKVK